MHPEDDFSQPEKVYAGGMAIDRLTMLIRATLTAFLALVTCWPAQALQAARVTITRDDWGIAHVKGRTDADAVFGMIYAQAEDDFNRVETNYLTSLGRLAEADGDEAIWKDLRQRLYIDPQILKADYASSPPWLRKLMQAWADGLNYYLATHPEVHPRVLTKFEPWMALSFTEGSIGGDIERVPLTQLQAFYSQKRMAMTQAERGWPTASPRARMGLPLPPRIRRTGMRCCSSIHIPASSSARNCR